MATEERSIAGLVMVTFEAFEHVVLERHAEAQPGIDAIAYLEQDKAKEIFHVDRAFWDHDDHHDHAVGTLVRTAMEHVASGKNFTAILLGEPQGKSSVLFGERPSGGGEHPSQQHQRHEGFILQLLGQVVELARSSPATMETTVKLTAVEISLAEKIRDCLNSGGSTGIDYRVRNHPEQGYFVENATSISIASSNDLPTIVHSLRHDNNSASASRKDFSQINAAGAGRAGHLLMQLTVKRRDGEKGVVRSSTVSIADVAGAVGSRGESKSLSALRRVVDVLSKNRKAVAPTRDSVLTTLLTESLGGNCTTVMLGSIFSSQTHQHDSLNVLRMIQKARGVICVPKVNEEKCTVVVKAIEQQMEQLRKQLTEDFTSPSNFKSLQDQLIARTQEVLDQREEKEKLKLTLEAQVQETSSELNRLTSLLQSRQLVREEALRMEREVGRLQAMRDLAAQKLLAENEISHRVEEELEKAKELEKEVYAAQQRAREQEDIARIENEKQQRRMMTAIFKASKMIGQDRQMTAAMNGEMARMREMLTEIGEAVRRVDERIGAGSETIATMEKRCAFLQGAEGNAMRQIKEHDDLSHVQLLQKLVSKRQDEVRQWTSLLIIEDQRIEDVRNQQAEQRRALGATVQECQKLSALIATEGDRCSTLEGERTKAAAVLHDLTLAEARRRAELIAMGEVINCEQAAASALGSRWQRELSLAHDAEADFSSLQAAIESFAEERERLVRLLAAKSQTATDVAACDDSQRRAVERDAELLLASAERHGRIGSICTPLKKPFAECRARFDASPVTKRFIQRIS